jgi:hypothetical protein
MHPDFACLVATERHAELTRLAATARPDDPQKRSVLRRLAAPVFREKPRDVPQRYEPGLG